MTTASNLYALSLEQCADLITAIGSERTVVVQGDMGSGKTSGLRKELSARHPNHLYVECDCTNKDIQDFSVPKFMQRVGDMISDYVEFVPNAELGAHLGKPVIINFDEFLKAPEPVKKGVRRVMLERMVNGIKLPEGSIVISVLRGGDGFVAKPDTVIESGDEVLVCLDPGLEEQVTPHFAAA